MATYSFGTLNDKEFEDLARDLLQKHLDLVLETFKKGKDQGIDLRYTTDKDTNSLIVQAKQYAKSGYSALYQKLKKEVPKVRKLNPLRYILVTSVPLSPSNKDAILNLFERYIKNTSDIIGEDDLNNLLEIFPEIQKAHIKLYLGSITVLNEIINHHIKSRSEHQIKEIQKGIHLFVTNRKYEEAIAILNREHFLIITGEPGVGKTALSNFITYQHLAEGFKFTYIISNFEDAEKVLNDDEKQFFYFDDFLGSNYLKIKYHPNQDSALLSFISRIKNNKNKRMILTTRTTILNQVRSDFDRLDSRDLEIARHEIRIDDYQPIDKGLILYNHLFHSDLPYEYLEELVSNKIYLKIIAHGNYSPRIIQYISEMSRLKGITAKEYPGFALEKLDHPQDIWKSPYESQITEADRFLLQTLFTLPRGINEMIAKEAFNARVDYEVKSNGFVKTLNLYSKTLQNLLGGFIIRKISQKGTFLEFFNPSFGDFMSSYLNNNKDEIYRILNGAIYFDQYFGGFGFQPEDKGLNTSILSNFFLGSLVGLTFTRNIEKVIISKKELFNIVSKKYDDIKLIYDNRSKELAICAFLIEHYDMDVCEPILMELYPYIDCELIESEQFEELFTIVYFSKRSSAKIAITIKENREKLFLRLFELVTDKRDFSKLIELFDIFPYDYKSFHDKYKERLQIILDEYWSSQTITSRLEDEDLSEILEESEMISALEKIEFELLETNEELKLKPSPGIKLLYAWEYKETVKLNQRNNESADDDDEYHAQTLNTNSSNELFQDPSVKITEMFDNLLDSKIENETK